MSMQETFLPKTQPPEGSGGLTVKEYSQFRDSLVSEMIPRWNSFFTGRVDFWDLSREHITQAASFMSHFQAAAETLYHAANGKINREYNFIWDDNKTSFISYLPDEDSFAISPTWFRETISSDAHALRFGELKAEIPFLIGAELIGVEETAHRIYTKETGFRKSTPVETGHSLDYFTSEAEIDGLEKRAAYAEKYLDQEIAQELKETLAIAKQVRQSALMGESVLSIPDPLSRDVETGNGWMDKDKRDQLITLYIPRLKSEVAVDIAMKFKEFARFSPKERDDILTALSRLLLGLYLSGVGNGYKNVYSLLYAEKDDEANTVDISTNRVIVDISKILDIFGQSEEYKIVYDKQLGIEVNVFDFFELAGVAARANMGIFRKRQPPTVEPRKNQVLGNNAASIQWKKDYISRYMLQYQVNS